MGSTPKIPKPIPQAEVTEISEDARAETLLRQSQKKKGASSTILNPGNNAGLSTTLGGGGGSGY